MDGNPPSADAAHDYEPHIGGSRQYMRDIILGVNDGLVSTFLLVSGVVGGGLEATQVLLTGIAGAVAGMVSMAIGEYLATKSQEEAFDAELQPVRKFLFSRMYRHSKVNRMMSKAKRVVRDLYTLLLAEPNLLPQDWRVDMESAQNDAERARLVADYVAGMTDRFAIEEHKKLFDPSVDG